MIEPVDPFQGGVFHLAGMLPNTAENMLRWLKSPQKVNPRTAMPDLGVTERDARDMAAYLHTLR